MSGTRVGIVVGEKLLVHLPVYTHSLTKEEHSYLTIQSVIV